MIGVPIADASWFRPVRAAGRLTPGTLAGKPLSVPDAAATRLLRGIVHAVADIPSGTSTVVVWQRDGSELWVDVGTVTLSSLDGMVRVAVKAGCDQLGKPVVLTVPLKVGTPQAPAGLVMSSVDRLTGPTLSPPCGRTPSSRSAGNASWSCPGSYVPTWAVTAPGCR